MLILRAFWCLTISGQNRLLYINMSIYWNIVDILIRSVDAAYMLVFHVHKIRKNRHLNKRLYPTIGGSGHSLHSVNYTIPTALRQDPHAVILDGEGIAQVGALV